MPSLVRSVRYSASGQVAGNTTRALAPNGDFIVMNDGTRILWG